ncbi:carboxylesterase 5A [Ixodes scapularis]|nr:carboxylesterase 5A [Ixodes scapularis]
MRLILVLALLGGAAALAAVTRRAVQTSSGLLRGVRSRISSMGHVEKFLGVPYARAPLGQLRFALPVPIEEDAARRQLDTDKHGPSCFQPPHLKEVMSNLLDTDSTEMSEDCLTLNVYVPELQDAERLPVIVWLPGEGFDYAVARHFDGSYLALQGRVIVVTVNYRVAAFGFLSTLTTEAPGNAGLFDQRMALKWVKKNIEHFGGNPDKVTLMGRFTGSMSGSIHLASPIKERLFERAVLQSGIAVGDYVFDSAPLNVTSKLANAVGCQRDSIAGMVSCLQELPASNLLSSSLRIGQSFRPVFDGELVIEEPMEAVKKGRHQAVDVIIGTNQHEGSLCLLTLQYLKSNFYDRLLRNTLTSEDLDEMVDYHLHDFTKKKDDVLARVVLHEYRYQHARETFRHQYIHFCGDMYLASHAEKMARLLSHHKKGSVFVYQFTHRPSFSTQPGFIGAAHGDDVLFALGLVLKQQDIPKEETLLSKKMALSLGNFADNSDPSLVNDLRWDMEWPEYNRNSKHVMHFVTGHLTAKPSKLDRATSFWHEVVPLLEETRTYRTVHQPIMTGHSMAMTSSRAFASEPGPLLFSSRPGIALSLPEHLSTTTRGTGFIIVAIAVCNVVLVVALTVSVTLLCRPQARYHSLEKL